MQFASSAVRRCHLGHTTRSCRVGTSFTFDACGTPHPGYVIGAYHTDSALYVLDAIPFPIWMFNVVSHVQFGCSMWCPISNLDVQCGVPGHGWSGSKTAPSAGQWSTPLQRPRTSRKPQQHPPQMQHPSPMHHLQPMRGKPSRHKQRPQHPPPLMLVRPFLFRPACRLAVEHGDHPCTGPAAQEGPATQTGLRQRRPTPTAAPAAAAGPSSVPAMGTAPPASSQPPYASPVVLNPFPMTSMALYIPSGAHPMQYAGQQQPGAGALPQGFPGVVPVMPLLFPQAVGAATEPQHQVCNATATM